ncbi:MAG: ABC transporter ATP-binding protein [Bacillota bacterium]|nr:ABC transporter ATP-binding protein [Bacillota bacterium]
MHDHHNFHEELTPGYDPKVFKRLLTYARPYSGMLFLSLLLILIVTSIQLAQPYILKIAIDDYILGPGTPRGLQRLGIYFLFIYALGMVLNYLQFIILMQTGQRIIHNIRMELFSHLQKLPIQFFDKNPVGRVVTKVTNDAETLNEMYTSFLVNFIKDLFMLTGIVIIMLRLHTTLALISFSIIPLVIAAITIYRKKARQAFRELRKQLSRINSFFAENIAGIRVIQVFNQERQRLNLFNEINDSHFLAGLKELKLFAVFRPIMDLFRSLALALLLWYGSGSVLTGVIPFGVLYAFITYLDQFFRPLNDMSDKYSILQAAMASAERIFDLMDEKQEYSNIQAKPLTTIQGSIDFDNVWFSYHNEDWVLKNVNFHIAPGEKIAVVGPTGAGKSSLINLINRFYNTTKGEIKIDGQDINKIILQDLRKQIGVIHQDVFLFSGTVKENITLNSIPLTDWELEKIAKSANAYEFIDRLPQKFDTPLGERGILLSSGQRQLLAFARMLAFNPSIFILDEATAHIDSYTEHLLQETLDHAAKGRTSIIIAHRLSTIKQADRIFLIREGRLKEISSFEELTSNLYSYFHE